MSDETKDTIRGLRSALRQMALMRDHVQTRLAEVEADRDALRSEVAAQVAMCPDCGEVETCDEDRCCASCGRDLLVFADRYSAELFTDGERVRDDERDTLRLRIAEVGEVLASDADEAALRQAVARLVYEAQDMGGER